MTVLVLFLVVVAWLALPFVPAVHEAIRRRDDGALPISDRYVEDLAGAPAPPAAEAPAEGARVGGYAYVGEAGLVTDEVAVRGVARLAAGSEVLRRVTAGVGVEVEPGTVLRGSVEAGEVVWLGTGVTFERVHAPLVEIGVAAGEPPERGAPTTPLALPDAEVLAGRALVTGDLAVPAGHRVEGDLVVTGDLTLGDGALVAGHVKAHGDVALAAGARVGGNVFANGSVGLGPWASVGGAAVAEGTLRLGRGASVGRPVAPTTASGRHVVVTSGARVYGTLWAEEGGRTVAEPAPTAEPATA